MSPHTAIIQGAKEVEKAIRDASCCKSFLPCLADSAILNAAQDAISALWVSVARKLAMCLGEAAVNGNRDAKVCVYAIVSAFNNVGANIAVKDDMSNSIAAVWEAIEFGKVAAKSVAQDIAEALGE